MTASPQQEGLWGGGFPLHSTRRIVLRSGYVRATFSTIHFSESHMRAGTDILISLSYVSPGTADLATAVSPGTATFDPGLADFM